MQSGSVFDPISSQTKAISDLFILTLIIGLGVFLLVTGLVIFAIIKYRARPIPQTLNSGEAPQDSEPVQLFGNTRLEIAWTVAPALLLGVLFVMTLATMNDADPQKNKEGPPDIEIIGHQYWWEFRYPKANVVTANEIHLPLGKSLLATTRSADVIHAFYVTQLTRQMDSEPDQVNRLFLKGDRAGIFPGACAQFCGQQHAYMLIKVIVEPEANYQNWLKDQAAPSPGVAAAASGDPAAGQKVFLANTCVNCHAITGTQANAQVGPSLSHFGSRSVIGAGVVPNTAENLIKWIHNPQDIKPGVLMPSYNLSDQDLRNLVTYLEGLK